MNPNIPKLHKILKDFQENVLDPYNVQIENLILEKESSEYGACNFELKNRKIIFRVAKITPTKVGQFVTLWKRDDEGPIRPFDMQDAADSFIIVVYDQNRSGQFIFSKDVLLKKGILTGDKEGKRGFRVYPSWDLPPNPQAEKTQSWQSEYFLENSKNKRTDTNRAKKILNL
ncbi:MepB family protein [Leptospira alstonii]|uniref:MepB protein n=2 Tax=Leptospira alstonii TaxID=28452 RepID=M6D997_9LEPT|nr:MepB family protein [Leptospira alstonii]EMJ95140.1 MepB protein [Leptospira alstonii serovar Sichuan str. 79601]EQA82202.1 MepB protein [Leptospira alstonii serovar Pingchang str. 80-412]